MEKVKSVSIELTNGFRINFGEIDGKWVSEVIRILDGRESRLSFADYATFLFRMKSECNFESLSEEATIVELLKRIKQNYEKRKNPYGFTEGMLESIRDFSTRLNALEDWKESQE